MNVRQAVVAADQSPFAFVPNPKRDPFNAFINLLVGTHAAPSWPQRCWPLAPLGASERTHSDS